MWSSKYCLLDVTYNLDTSVAKWSVNGNKANINQDRSDKLQKTLQLSLLLPVHYNTALIWGADRLKSALGGPAANQNNVSAQL